ncbi:hypothetical protein CEUSTIGMA_g9482.t1 [Chlamydomonas eustigma]|uniref:Transmembrane protein n=1 Tax=Chlamydomonas eustigma TaxID=1157962 RepID=A0A250XG51_9CHLO|nr:hypothetical protein CEUSTIGMA_g9482.t1 [Chlamydomonas eustigma]|eukprot:GAX82054.1 hypothetical protein CEUSTIGMA_g9482.t1 [Chlamydomonas eustigma]
MSWIFQTNVHTFQKRSFSLLTFEMKDLMCTQVRDSVLDHATSSVRCTYLRRTTNVRGPSIHRIRNSRKRLTAKINSSLSGYEFEPHVDAAVLASQLVVASSSLGLGAYWWFVVVPSERAALAKAKRKGGVGEYLKEVKSDPDRKLEQWFYTDWLRSSWFQAKMAREVQTESTAANIIIEATATDSSSSTSTSKDLSEDEKPNPNLLQPTFETPTPSFWSLDNPIVAAMALISAGVVFSMLFKMIYK